MFRRKIRVTVLAGLAFFIAGLTSLAYGQQSAPIPTSEQLTTLLAPIALYPDTLLAQICTAAGDPQQVLDVNNWVKQNTSLTGTALNDAAQKQGFDPAFIALVTFPSVLDQMAQNIDDYAAIGAAFKANQASVTSAIQSLRQQAYASGALDSNEYQKVSVENQNGTTVVIVQPTNPQVVYVPQYEPAQVYTSAPSSSDLIAASLVSFTVGIAIGAIISNNQPWGWNSWGWGWGGGGGVYYGGRPWGWHYGYHSPYPPYRPRPPYYGRPVYPRPPPNWNNRPGYRPPPPGYRPPGPNRPPGYRPPPGDHGRPPGGGNNGGRPPGGGGNNGGGNGRPPGNGGNPPGNGGGNGRPPGNGGNPPGNGGGNGRPPGNGGNPPGNGGGNGRPPGNGGNPPGNGGGGNGRPPGNGGTPPGNIGGGNNAGRPTTRPAPTNPYAGFPAAGSRPSPSTRPAPAPSARPAPAARPAPTPQTTGSRPGGFTGNSQGGRNERAASSRGRASSGGGGGGGAKRSSGGKNR